MSEPTMYDVLEAVQNLSTHMDGEFASVRSDIGVIRSDIGVIQSDVDTVKTDQRGVRNELADIQFGLVEVRNEMVTKTELNEQLTVLKSEISTEIDRFVVVHTRLDHELMAQRSRFNRIEDFLVKVAGKLGIHFEVT